MSVWKTLSMCDSIHVLYCPHFPGVADRKRNPVRIDADKQIRITTSLTLLRTTFKAVEDSLVTQAKRYFRAFNSGKTGWCSVMIILAMTLFQIYSTNKIRKKSKTNESIWYSLQEKSTPKCFFWDWVVSLQRHRTRKTGVKLPQNTPCTTKHTMHNKTQHAYHRTP